MEIRRRIEKWQIDKLKPYPTQAHLFNAYPPSLIKDLARRMEIGLDHPVEITPDGTIICGHKRVRAAQLLGWKEIDVWVRDDLAAQGPIAIEERMIWDNLARQHMGPLEKARCYQRLKALATQGDSGWMKASAQRELRDKIGAVLEMSGRNLDRLLRIIEHTPQEVQDAVAAGKLSSKLAYQVSVMPEPQKKQIAGGIAAGGDPSKIIREAIGEVDKRHKDPRDAKRALFAMLRRAIDDLEGRESRVGWISDEERELLKRFQALLKKFQKQADKQPKEPVDVRELLGGLTKRKTSA